MHERTEFPYLNALPVNGIMAMQLKQYLSTNCSQPSQFYTTVNTIIQEVLRDLGPANLSKDKGTIYERRHAEIAALQQCIHETLANGQDYGRMYFSDSASPICIYNDEPLYNLCMAIGYFSETPIWCYFGGGNMLISKLLTLLEHVRNKKVTAYLNDQAIITLQKNTLTEYKDYKEFLGTYKEMVTATRANQEQAAKMARQEKEILDLKKRLEDNNNAFEYKLHQQKEEHQKEMLKLSTTLERMQADIEKLKHSADENAKDAVAWRQATNTRTPGSSKYFKKPSTVPEFSGGPFTKKSKSPREDFEVAPEEFLCPINHTIMENPVIAQDGNSYEEQAIKQWFGSASEKNSPCTHKKIKCTLKPNITLKACIVQWRQTQAPIPDAFICPLTKRVMRDPVIDEDGKSYERTAYIQDAEKKKIIIVDVVPNTNLRNWIQTFIANSAAPSPRLDTQITSGQ